ncbi:hydrophobic surface binding protein [Mucor ambiguus]|uniref:Hydrophobic surface binding protein n=1 Tax=Mucor ambiguus TaxID=91626 RepID=A0A0C9LUL1_9FUNG|nr:hydrophobic surface binding protein [Mucor ambiguus]
MRASLFAIALTIAASVNAAAVQKRTVTAGVQACVDGLNAASAQLLTVTSQVNSFTSAAGYSGALAVHSSEQTLETKLKAAITSCCAVTTTVSEEDATAVFSVVGVVVPEIENALSAIVTKKPQFDAVLLATSLVKTDIKNLNTEVNSLDTCLIAVTPAADLANANAYVGRVNTAFASAKTAYGI